MQFGQVARASRPWITRKMRVPHSTPSARGTANDDACLHEIFRESALICREWRLVRVQASQSVPPKQILYSTLVRQTTPEIVGEDQAAARLAATNRFSLSNLCARGASRDSGWAERSERSRERAARRD